MTRLKNLVLTVVFGGVAASCAQARVVTPDQPPRPIIGTQIVPIYPTVSRTLGEQGTSRLQLGIDTDRNITDCRIIKSAGEHLDAAACAFVKNHWRYQPATHNGMPIASSDSTALVWDLNGVTLRP